MRAMLAPVLAAVIAAVGASSTALASHQQVAILQDDPSLLSTPVSSLQELRQLGVEVVRVSLRWSLIAPSPTSHRRPRFNATNPNAYPAGGWQPYDKIVRAAAADGIGVMFVPTGFAPIWAQGPNPGRYGGRYDPRFAWEPSASEYGAFVRAVGSRYSGTFRPPGSDTPLPRVGFWELYNEPNFGEDLAPQAIDGSSVLYAPRMYRALAGAGWGALRASGHGADTIVIGALAAAGAQAGPGRLDPQGLPGTYGETKPLVFIRELYCLDPNYRPYRGAAAAIRGCPATAAGSRRFRVQNPVLFKATGFSDHPYVLSAGRPPNQPSSPDPSYAQFSELPRFAATIDRVQRVYHSVSHFPIWDTEYGYLTCPPVCDVHHYVSPTTAAAYMNWAEYLSWRNPRIVSWMQYLLNDPNPTVATPEFGGFASGLIFYRAVQGGRAKPGYNAYRLPIFLPITSTRRGHTLEVWGAARPAPFALADTGQPQYVQIQFARGSSSSWSTLKTVQITDPHGYLDVRVAFPSSGSVRLAWTYPPLDAALGSTLANGYIEPLGPATSRSVNVTIR